MTRIRYEVWQCRVGNDRTKQGWCHSHHTARSDDPTGEAALAEAKTEADYMHRPDGEGIEAYVTDVHGLTVVYDPAAAK